MHYWAADSRGGCPRRLSIPRQSRSEISRDLVKTDYRKTMNLTTGFGAPCPFNRAK